MPSSVLSKITKELFAQALKNQIKTTSLQQITIKEISKECGLNRRTFYRHFKDIYDLVEWIYQIEILDQINQDIDFFHWRDGFLAILNYFSYNKEISYSVFKTSDRKNLEKFLYSTMMQLITPVIEQESYDTGIPQHKKDFLSNFYALSFTAIIIQWVDRGMKDNPEDIVKNISLVLQGSTSRVIESG
ncbi:MAG: TetR/AcrR family transcriptional regulator C-terminal domain-containing protein [Clostridiaceae bacterium]|nr:TetR/AcrR family transcriptional regulator C-terminal domain-containing protein [Clostridiaceae bacterium]